MTIKSNFKKQHTCLGCHREMTKGIKVIKQMGWCDNCGEYPYVIARVNTKGKLLGEYNKITCWNCEVVNDFYFPYRIQEQAKNCKNCGELAIVIDDTFVREYLNDTQENLHILKGGK